MIQVSISRSQNGEFVSCKAKGHAEFATKGKDIVCAGVTSVLRTVLSLLEQQKELKLEINNTVRGELAFHVLEKKTSLSDFLVYTANFLVTGIEMIEKEFPKCIKLRVIFE